MCQETCGSPPKKVRESAVRQPLLTVLVQGKSLEDWDEPVTDTRQAVTEDPLMPAS